MSLSKIQIIKLLREVKPGLGLKEAKDLVDSYEVRGFEDRVARALGEEARQDLYNWARLWAHKRGMRYVDNSYVQSYEETYRCNDECCRTEV